jgi:hypothetical protein
MIMVVAPGFNRYIAYTTIRAVFTAGRHCGGIDLRSIVVDSAARSIIAWLCRSQSFTASVSTVTIQLELHALCTQQVWPVWHERVGRLCCTSHSLTAPSIRVLGNKPRHELSSFPSPNHSFRSFPWHHIHGPVASVM